MIHRKAGKQPGNIDTSQENPYREKELPPNQIRCMKYARYQILVAVVLSLVFLVKLIFLFPGEKKASQISVDGVTVKKTIESMNKVEKSLKKVSPYEEISADGVSAGAVVKNAENNENGLQILPRQISSEKMLDEISVDGITTMKKSIMKRKNINEINKSPNLIPPDAKIILKPVFGTHRPNSDAIFTNAHGYGLFQFLVFFYSLLKTGYSGDVVISIDKNASKQVIRFLQSLDNVVVYMPSMKCSMDHEEIRVRPAYQLFDLFGDITSGKPIADPRKTRAISIVRAELFYAWSLHYSSNSWIFTSDFRDSFFQKNPVKELDRGDEENSAEYCRFANEPSFNDPLMTIAYGKDVLNEIKDKHIICNGWSVGKANSMQIFLFAMIKEFNETQCPFFGCEQQFHNYLVHTNKLSEMYKIRFRVYEQGKGLVNNLSCISWKNLKAIGVLKAGKVLNWNGSLSTIVHHYTYNDELKREIRRQYIPMFHAYDHELKKVV